MTRLKEGPIMKCKPVTLDQIKGGQTYITVVVCENGSMYLDRQTFYGQPTKDKNLKRMLGVESWKIRSRPKSQDVGNDSDLLNFDHASDLGLDPNRRYNDHRVFRFNMRNEQVLVDLVNRQALEEYLTLIGVENVEEKVLKYRSHTSLFDDGFDDDYWGDDDWDDDYIDSIPDNDDDTENELDFLD